MNAENTHQKLKAAAYIRMSTEHQIYSPVTKPEMLRVQPLKRNSADIEKLASLENAIGKIHKEYKLIYSDFGKHVTRLQVAQAWVRSIFANALARKFLEKNYPDILRRFNELVDLTDLNDLKDDNTAGNPAL